MTGIFHRINECYNDFTNSELKIAEYVFSNALEIMRMSISDLADICGVSDATVFRFCKTLNLKGYQDFKVTLAQSLDAEGRAEVRASGEIERDDTVQQVCEKVLGTIQSALTDTFALLDSKSIEKAVDMLVEAQGIYFFGVGSSGLIAQEAYDLFLRITNKTRYFGDSHFQAIASSLMSEYDVAVAFSYSGITKDAIDVLKLAKAAGARIICVTRFPNSAFTEHADVVLCCGSNESPMRGGSVASRVTQQYIVNVLYSQYLRCTYEESIKNKETTAMSIVNKLL